MKFVIHYYLKMWTVVYENLAEFYKHMLVFASDVCFLASKKFFSEILSCSKRSYIFSFIWKSLVIFSFFRSSHQKCSLKKFVFKIFAIFTKKTSVLESVFNKVAGLKACKKRLQGRVAPVNIAKFVRTPIWKNICEQLLLFVSFFSLV